MADLVRARLENGYEATVSAALAESAGLEVLDAPSVDLSDRPLPTTRANGRPIKPPTSALAAENKDVTAASALPAEEASA